MSAATILLVIALLCWFLAALPPPGTVQLGWLGMFFWGLSQLIR